MAALSEIPTPRGAAARQAAQAFRREGHILAALEALHTALGDVFAVIAYYLARPDEIDEYLHKCDEEADGIRRTIEGSQPPGPSKEDLLARAKAKGLNW